MALQNVQAPPLTETDLYEVIGRQQMQIHQLQGIVQHLMRMVPEDQAAAADQPPPLVVSPGDPVSAAPDTREP